MSVTDRIEDFMGATSPEVNIEEADERVYQIVESGTITDEDVIVLDEGPKVETYGFKGGLFHVKIGGKPYSYKVDTSDMINKATGERLSGTAADTEFERRFRKMSGFSGGKALQQLLAPRTNMASPWAGGLKSAHAIEAKYFDGNTTPPVVGGTAAKQVKGVSVPAINPKGADSLAHATKGSFSSQMNKVLGQATSLRNEIHKLAYGDFQGVAFADALHKLHDAIAEIERKAK